MAAAQNSQLQHGLLLLLLSGRQHGRARTQLLLRPRLNRVPASHMLSYYQYPRQHWQHGPIAALAPQKWQLQQK
jgi:hypothetical protein